MVRQPLTLTVAPRRLPAWLLTAVLAGGCATGYPPTAPGESEGGPPPQTTVPPAPEAPPPAESAPPSRPASNTEAPTLALLRQSRRSADGGDLAGAIAYVERAIRLNPRDAALWLELARLQLRADRPARAEQLAQKAIALSREDSGDHRDAWLLVADAKQAQGQMEDADRIRARWRTYRG